MIDEDQIKVRIEQLKDEREKFVTQANQQITAYNAVIDELTRLVTPQDNAPQQ